MKKGISCALLVLVLLLSACSQEAAATWQEQYDLGVRYLSEGNYREAVIAFSAAIEIDPKQADAYVGLADAYVAQGDVEQARQVLEDALAVVSDANAIQSRLDVLAGGAAPTSTPGATAEPAPSSAAGGSDGTDDFTFRPDYRAFEDYTAEEQQFISSMAAAAIAEDTETMQSLLGPEFYGCTIWNGYQIDISSPGEETTDEGDRSAYIVIELRPENGIGYYYYLHCINGVDVSLGIDWSDAVFIDQIICPCENWQWNGAMEYTYSYYHYITWTDGGTVNSSDIVRTTGNIVNSLRDGVFVSERHYVDVWSNRPDNNEDIWDSVTKIYQNGVLIEVDGQPVEDGQIYNIYYFGDSSYW